MERRAGENYQCGRKRVRPGAHKEKGPVTEASLDRPPVGLRIRQFMWSDHSVPIYKNWAPHEPNGNAREPCGNMWTGHAGNLGRASGYWNDLACRVRSDLPCGFVYKMLPLVTSQPDSRSKPNVVPLGVHYYKLNSKDILISIGVKTALNVVEVKPV